MLILSIIVAIAGLMLACLFPFLNGAGKSWPEVSPDHTIGGEFPHATRGGFFDISFWYLADDTEDSYPSDVDSFMDATYDGWHYNTYQDVSADFVCAKGTGSHNALPSGITDLDIDDFFSDVEYMKDRDIARKYGWEI